MDNVCAREHGSPHALGQDDRDRDCDHFYLDEADPSRLGRGPAARPDLNVFLPQTYRMSLSNPLAAKEKADLRLGASQDADLNKRRDYFIFVPTKVDQQAAHLAASGRRAHVRVSLLFCVGDQMNRAGLRTYFADRDDAVLITIPGVEARGGRPVPWAIGISDAQIQQLLRTAGLDVDYQVSVLAGYSTGYHGLQSTLIDRTVSLSALEHVVYYDCLYAADQYPKGKRTVDAIAALRAASTSAKIVIYEVTESGTRRYGGRLAINDPAQILINLKSRPGSSVPYSVYLNALIYARLLDEGVKDNFFKLTDIPAGLRALIPKLKKRGELASLPVAIPIGPPRPGAKVASPLEQWGNDNRAAIFGMQGELSIADNIIYQHDLMGWSPNLVSEVRGEAQHDQFAPEFAWEYLPPP
jgi:hypothetical protein